MIHTLKSERVVIAIAIGTHRFKLAQIIFSQRDGTLFIAFPYLKDGGGQVCLGTLPPNRTYPGNYDLRDGGKITAHNVKYAHHPDGEVHFSQDGKVRTEIRKRGVPLHSASGHIFTIQAQGLNTFEEDLPRPGKPVPINRRATISFGFHAAPSAVKVVGHWYSGAKSAGRFIQRNASCKVVCYRPDGPPVQGVVLSSKFKYHNEERYLIVTCEEVARIIEAQSTFLSFLGGFDPEEVALDHSQATSFIAFAYPLKGDLESLKRTIGSIDLR